MTPERGSTEMRTSRCLGGYMESINLAWNVSSESLKEPLVIVKPFQELFEGQSI